ncbi:MAG: hypothetical protein GY724_20825, partial [Actinomycetia bacterium]|nr:hypothetical protein [Actinomycetes bacterium]
VAVVHLTTGPTSGQESGAEATIAGRSFREPDYPEGPWAEELPDGTWLEYQTAAGDLILEEVAAAITYDDGKVHFEPTETGIELVGAIDDISSQATTSLTYPIAEFTPEFEAPNGAFSIATVAVTDPQAPLLWSSIAPSLERVVVRGSDGYIMTMTPSDGGEITAVIWYSPTGHAVAVFTNRSRTDALALAEGLRSVDEATWRAALTDPDSSDQESESGLDPWPEVAQAKPEQTASIGDVVDASRLVSDAVPAGLELTLAVDNTDLGPPLSLKSRAAYLGQAGTAAMWVETTELTDWAQFKDLSSYSNALVSHIDEVEVVILGDGLKLATFETSSRLFSINGSLQVGAEPLSDEELLTAARTIIEHRGPTV